ncbi:autoinducer synthase [Actibacterium mucosum KCTC 23349]|uniref:Autoinducer synthase n=1 Tax=Actibacterium mucosum KCTC 23349 TaxID=1454373 RepID=A0A037ZIS5_9RHOB|nr:acyl-homoserine-lactone synthase [Actibacterium mucosum]KAJ55422.1 autoinducer synthase [Actibacterium mucosum KCTC 23349]
MHNISFEFAKLHQHGNAFFDYLTLRKKVFVDDLGWDVPHNADFEMDQYDTPVACYSLVMKDGKVVGGARAMTTTATWGEHTYMLRDAHSGKLAHIPPEVMERDIASPLVWECTRLVISDDLNTAAERSECLRMIVDGLVGMAQERGAVQMICLSSLLLMRALRQLGYEVTLVGPTYRNSEDGRSYGVLSMPAAFAGAYAQQPVEQRLSA